MSTAQHAVGDIFYFNSVNIIFWDRSSNAMVAYSDCNVESVHKAFNEYSSGNLGWKTEILEVIRYFYLLKSTHENTMPAQIVYTKTDCPMPTRRFLG
jgi:hypothetical protein